MTDNKGASPVPSKEDLEAIALQKRDRKDILKCAYDFLIFHRCRKCEHLTVKGYICQHCNDSDPGSPPEPAAVRPVAGGGEK